MKHRWLSLTLAASMVVPGFSYGIFAEEAPGAETPAETTAEQTEQETPAAAETPDPAESGEQTETPTETTDPAQTEDPADNPETPAGTEEQPGQSTTEIPDEEQPAETPETPADPAQNDPAAQEPGTDTEQGETPADPDDMFTDPDPNAPHPHRDGTDITTSLSLNTMADGAPATVIQFDPAKDAYQIQVGGSLDMTKVWSKYSWWVTMFVIKNGGTGKLFTKSLLGDYTYEFTVNPEVVSVDESILCDPAAWQEAFRTGSGEAAATFFNFMQCTNASYDPATGKVTVNFKINENGTNMVACKTLYEDVTAKPDTIKAYSPAGALYIKPENYKKGAYAVEGEADFKGEIDMSPWMAAIFPVRFNSDINFDGLQLDVPDATVAFNVENGTWADGTTDPKTVSIPMDIVKTDNGVIAAGTLGKDLIPEGMKALAGYDPATGKWVPAIDLNEYGIVLKAAGQNAADYTFTFEKEKPVEPEKPEEPSKPSEPEKPQQPAKPQTPAKPEASKPVNKPSKPNTGVMGSLSAFAAMTAAAGAGVVAMLKRKNK